MTPNEIKLGSTERTDDQGTYTHYHRTCTFRDCNVELTSRNRSGSNLLCKPCAAAKARGIYTGQPRKPRTALEKAVLANQRAEPDRTKAHSMLNDVLDRPTSEDHKHALNSFLMMLAIRAHLRHLPNVATPTNVV